MAKTTKRHLRRDIVGTTYCGRPYSKTLVTIHPTKARKDDCVWCRRTYRSEIRGIREMIRSQ